MQLLLVYNKMQGLKYKNNGYFINALYIFWVTRQFFPGQNFPGNVVRVLGKCCHKSGKFCQRLKSAGQLFPHFFPSNLCYLWLCRYTMYNQNLILCQQSCLNMCFPLNWLEPNPKSLDHGYVLGKEWPWRNVMELKWTYSTFLLISHARVVNLNYCVLGWNRVP